MRLSSNANRNSMSHAFVATGFYEIELKYSYSTTRNEPYIIKHINSTYISVQEKITQTVLKVGYRYLIIFRQLYVCFRYLQGSEDVLLEVDSVGSWVATIGSGSHVVYHWIIEMLGEEENDVIEEEYTLNREVF